MRFHLGSLRVKLLLVLALFFEGGCATVRQSNRPAQPFGVGAQNLPSQPEKKPEVMGPPEAYGPVELPRPAPHSAPGALESQDATSYGPHPVLLHPIVLVLGPGMARGYAYVGVFQALKEAKVPIGAILGTEMGAFIGALYANSSTINQFEWGLMKFKEDLFHEKSGFLRSALSKPIDDKKFEDHLFQIFSKKDLSDLKIPVKVGFQGKDNGTLWIVDHGKVVDAIRSAMVYSTKSRPFLVSEARAMGIGPVVVVDVLNSSESAAAADELKGADLMIKPDVNGSGGIGDFDYQKRTDAAFRGKVMTRRHLKEIRRLVGLTEDPSDDSSQVQGGG